MSAKKSTADDTVGVVTAIQTDVEPSERRKKKQQEAEPAPAPNYDAWRPADRSASVQHFDAAEPSDTQSVNTAQTTADSAPAPSKPSPPAARTADRRPTLSYSQQAVQPGLYSDSGRTVCMAMRLISYVLFGCAPVYFICKVFELFSADAGSLNSGIVISTLVISLIFSLLFVIGGILVIALIKILQNLMAMPKK